MAERGFEEAVYFHVKTVAIGHGKSPRKNGKTDFQRLVETRFRGFRRKTAYGGRGKTVCVTEREKHERMIYGLGRPKSYVVEFEREGWKKERLEKIARQLM